MGLGHTKTTVTPQVEVFPKVLENAQGGFTLYNTALTAGDTVYRGTVMGYDESTRYAKVVKQAILYEAAENDDVAYKVKKGHHFKVADIFAYVVGGAAYAITEITTTETAYDTITIGTTLGVAIEAGEVLFQAETAGSDTASLLVEPKGLLYEDTVVAANEPVSVLIKGTAYKRRLPCGACDAVVTALSHIVFSESK